MITLVHLTQVVAWAQGTIANPHIWWAHHTYDSIYLTGNETDVTISVYITTKNQLKSLTVSMLNEDGNIISKSTQVDKQLPQAVQRVPTESEYHFEKRILVAEEVVTLKIEAVDKEDRYTSSTKVFIYKPTLIEQKINRRNDHALIFATDKYVNWSQLSNPLFDAHAMAKTLETTYGFTTEIIENATKEQIITKMKEYRLKKYGQFDQLLIFFAGHGAYNNVNQLGYVITSDSKSGDQSYPTSISHEWLKSNIDQIPVNHILLVMDVCFSGALEETGPVSGVTQSVKPEDIYGNASRVDILKRKFNHNSRLYITSGGKEYVSDGIPGMHSPFMHQFIRALNLRGFGDYILTNAELTGFMENLKTEPRFGSFGEHERGGDFILTANQN